MNLAYAEIDRVMDFLGVEFYDYDGSFIPTCTANSAIKELANSPLLCQFTFEFISERLFDLLSENNKEMFLGDDLDGEVSVNLETGEIKLTCRSKDESVFDSLSKTWNLEHQVLYEATSHGSWDDFTKNNKKRLDGASRRTRHSKVG